VIYAPEPASQASAHGHSHSHDYGLDEHINDSEGCEADDELNHEEVKVGRDRHVVGILVSLFSQHFSVKSLLKAL
jgi:hypothetical protein